jgi:hypothetical protein
MYKKSLKLMMAVCHSDDAVKIQTWTPLVETKTNSLFLRVLAPHERLS